MQDNCAITPVISESSANFIEGLVKDAEAKGAKLLQKYKREGNLIWPLLIDNVTPVRTCARLSVSSAAVLLYAHHCSESGVAGACMGIEPAGPAAPCQRDFASSC